MQLSSGPVTSYLLGDKQLQITDKQWSRAWEWGLTTPPFRKEKHVMKYYTGPQTWIN
jgi:hypothetical protein